MSANPVQSVPAAAAGFAGIAPERKAAETAKPLCFVIDSDASIREMLGLVLRGMGVDTEEFADNDKLGTVLARREPNLVFVDIPAESSEAIAALIALGAGNYCGKVQLVSNRGAAVLTHLQNIGEQHRLQMLPPLRKPFETNAIMKILEDLKLGSAAVNRIDLGEALAKNWIEFWYQPKIDLRKKQLIGAEAFARVNHPQYGVLMPNAFMPGASEGNLVALSEKALSQALQVGAKFGKLGVHLRMAVNIPANALVRLGVADIVKTYRPQFDKWPGLIIDVAEEQIVSEINLAGEVAKKLEPLNVKLAIDDFGRGYASLLRLKNLPFAELKLDRMFVTDCSTDKVNAPLCKTVIDLAHSFGSVAVAIGIEKATDAMALVKMGCDYGQGFLLGQPMTEEKFLSLLRQRAQLKPEARA